MCNFAAVMEVAEYISFPLSVLLGVVLLLCVVLTAWSDRRWLHVVRRPWWAAVLLGLFAFLNMAGGTWSMDIQHRIILYINVLLIMWSLGVVTMDRKKQIPVMLLHGGLFLVLAGGMFGAGDKTDGQTVLHYGQPAHTAYRTDGERIALPFDLQIDTFFVDYYPDGRSPKQYTTRFTLHTQEETLQMETSVNRPCRYRGYRFYQSSYDPVGNAYSVLKVVRDPWLPVVWLGVAMLFIGACWQIARQWRGRWLLAAVVAVGMLFTVVTVAKINFGTLVPALRSAWFVPHIGVYMLAYSALAIALGAGILIPWRNTFPLMMRLVQTASCLLLVGMLCGAVWAQQAWGDYWAWDPKECWAAATWMLTLAAIHIGQKDKGQRIKDKRLITIVLLLVLLAFAAMQMTWYGVNYLPSAAESLHTYTI